MKLNGLLLTMLPLITVMCTPVEEHSIDDGTWIDLTHDFSEETLFWPTSETFKLDTVVVGQMEGGYYYESYKFSTAEHGGTHLDAPIHFFEGKKTVEQLNVNDLTGWAVVIDVSTKAEDNRDYQILPEDIEHWESGNGVIPNGAMVLFYTGLSDHWPNAEQYLGTAMQGEEALPELSFPGIHPETAQWLVDNRNIKAVGLDTPSLDYGKSTQYETHQILFEQDIPGFENVANLNKLPATGAYVVALPMKIKDGSGAPLRIIANVME